VKTLIQAARPILIDLAATLVFTGVAALSGKVLVATALAIAVGAAQVAWCLARRQPVGALQWIGLGLVLVFGAASLVTHSPRFMMAKPTVIYLLISAGMLQRGWMLRYAPARALAHVGEGPFVAWGYVWAAMMALTAVANAGFAAFASLATWSLFITIVPPVSKIALFGLQFGLIRFGPARAAQSTAQSTALAA
jgi:intracellular septation protein